MAEPARKSKDEQQQDEREKELEGGRMPFLQHLVELRDRLRNAAIAFMLAFLVCWYFSADIFEWLRGPLFDIWSQHCDVLEAPGRCIGQGLVKAGESWGPPTLIYTQMTQPFWVGMSIGLWAGIFVASPFIFYQLWKFIAPGLYKKERRITVTFACCSAVFFVCGALFCFYFALPKLYAFLLSYNSPDLRALPSISDYLDLTRDMMLAFGAIFELPLLIYFLAMVGLVTHRGLWKFSRWFIVLAFIIGAILTPGPDVVSQFLMATPMIVLYNISILFAWRVTVKRERKQKELERLEREADERERAERAAKKKKVVVEEDDDESED
jgi:sec-independent protein translocase protein TatC